MKNNKSKLDRLFAMARDAGEEPVPAMPWLLKTRILASWRRGADVDEGWSAVVTAFRRGLVCAGLVAVFAVLWSFAEPGDATLNDEAMANYELQTEVMQ